MNELQTAWITQVTGARAAQQALDQQEMQKQALLAKLASDRNLNAGILQAGSDLTMVDKKGSSQKTLDRENHDQTDEFDLDEQRDGFTIADRFGKIEKWDPVTGTQEEFQKHLETGRRVNLAVYEMETAMADELDEAGQPVMEVLPDGSRAAKRKRLFSDEDIATEIYDPMRRNGLIPETSIPDKFSRTREMLDGSFEAYGKRLKADKMSLGKRLFSENASLVKTMGLSTFSIVGSGIQLESIKGSTSEELATSWDPKENIQSLKINLGEIPKEDGSFAGRVDIDSTRLAFASQAMSFVTDVAVEGVGDISEALEPGVAERAAAAEQLATALISAASSELVKPHAGSGLAMDIGATFGTVVKRSLIAGLLRARDFPEASVTAIAAELGRACQATLLKLDPAMPALHSTALLTTAGGAFVSTMAGKPAPAAVLKAFDEVNLRAAVEAFRVALEQASRAAASPALELLLHRVDVRDQVLVKAADAMQEAFLREEEEEPVPPELKADHARTVSGHEAAWVKSPDGWVCSICDAKADKEDPAVFAGIVERKIAQLERDQALLKWGSTLVGLGIDTAANFIAPLAIAGCALKMARNLYEAGKRTRDMTYFIEDRQGMFNAASAFSAPVTKFIHNAGLQQAHFYANAAFEAAKMIGAIIQCAGVTAAPAGAVVSVAASIAQASEAVLYEVAKRVDLEVGWYTYKQALSRPENRKMGLIALKRNATLAKYSMAWGAIIKKDPLVADFMDACGLTAQALKDPGADLDKVVKYLETRMPEDVVVVGRTAEGSMADWAPAKVELTPDSWIAVKSRGEDRGGIAPQDTRSFELALKNFAESFPAWEAAATATPSTLGAPEYQALSDLLSRLQTTLERVSSKRSDGQNSPEMDNVKKQFLAMIAVHKTQSLAWAPEPVPV